MKYKNVTKEILRFRAHEINGVKTDFALKPNEEVELYRTDLEIEGLEKKIKKTKKGDN